MRHASLPFFALCYCAISGCGLLFDTEDLRSTGGAGDGTGAAVSVTSTGGAPFGGGPTGAGVPGGAGPNGGGGVGGGKSCEDGEAYCGPGSQCDVDGLCTVVSVAASSAEIVNVLFVKGSDGGHVVAQTTDSGVGITLFSWTLGFSQDTAPMAVFALNDPGIGFIVAGGANHVYYAGQAQNCDADPANDSCVNVCRINARGLDCFAPTALSDGSHINGAVLVPAASPVEDRLYFVESNDTSSERLQWVTRECLEVPGPPCAAGVATNYDAPDALDPLGLDRDPFDGSVWWNTWGGSGQAGGCVYQYPAAADLAQCEQTVPAIAHPNRLALSANSVFVGSYTASGEAGPIQRLQRCMVGGQHPVTEFGNVTWPADADADFLYATSIASPNELRVLNANTGLLVKVLLAEANINSVDATHPDFLLFAAGNRLYRWRKLPSPCLEAPGLGACGDGCVDTGEDCDDGNLDDGDGCGASCECELPQQP